MHLQNIKVKLIIAQMMNQAKLKANSITKEQNNLPKLNPQPVIVEYDSVNRCLSL